MDLGVSALGVAVAKVVLECGLRVEGLALVLVELIGRNLFDFFNRRN